MRLTSAFVILACLLGTAVAQTCVDDLTGRDNNCTASDVTIATLQVLPGGVIDPCSFAGDTAVVNVQATLVAGAEERYDIGLFIAEDGGDARTGTCVHEWLPPPLLSAGSYDPTSGTGPFYQGELANDFCGDIEQNVNTLRNIDGLTLLCLDTDNDNVIDVGTVVSWDNNAVEICTSIARAVPGTTAKCRAERIDVVGLPPPPSTTTTSTSTSTSSSTSSSTTSTSTSSTTSTTVPFDAFQCYEIKPATAPAITFNVQDRFTTMTETVRFPHRLCAPADEDGQGLLDPDQHLIGYVMRGQTFEGLRGLTVTTQLGTLQIDLRRANTLMMPSSKSLTGAPPPLPPPTIDHFQCYKVRRSRGSAKFVKQDMTLTDQFKTQTETLVKPFLLCAPADKNGEDPTAPTHPTSLLCFKTKGVPFATLEAHIHNQLGPDDATLIHRRELCLPASVMMPPPPS